MTDVSRGHTGGSPCVPVVWMVRTDNEGDVKHTYLYPLESGEEWLWQASRCDAVDLFGNPALDAPETLWQLSVKVGGAVANVREEFHKRLESRDRVCIGRHYVVPGSRCDAAQDRAQEADLTVHAVTVSTWDAPPLDGTHYANTFALLSGVAGRDGRDGWEDIRKFLVAYRGHKVVPVWM